MTWFGSTLDLRSDPPMEDSQRLQAVVDEFAPARWIGLEANYFSAEFFAQVDTSTAAAAAIQAKVTTVEDRLRDLGAKVEGLSQPLPASPPKRPPLAFASM